MNAAKPVVNWRLCGAYREPAARGISKFQRFAAIPEAIRREGKADFIALAGEILDNRTD